MDPDHIDSIVTLGDGRVVHIRAIRASDEAEILQAFDRMSADARYMRFMHTVPEHWRTTCTSRTPKSGTGRATRERAESRRQRVN